MLRFSKGHKLSENFYVRQDGTRAYYFSTGNYMYIDRFWQLESKEAKALIWRIFLYASNACSATERDVMVHIYMPSFYDSL